MGVRQIRGRMMNQRINIDIPQAEINDFCRKNHIRKLSLFGSVLRSDFSLESDIDMLVEFESGQVVGYFGLAGMERKLTEIVGCKVDLRTPKELSRYFREEVLDSAEVIYERA